jgi:heat shock protein HspQ
VKPKFEPGDLVSHPLGYKGVIVGVDTGRGLPDVIWRPMAYKVYFFRHGKTLCCPGYHLRKLEAKDDNQV